MAKPLSEFISFIKKNSIARTNRFRIQFSIPPKVAQLANYIGKDDIGKTISLTCLIADIPGQSTQSTAVNYGNYDRKVVYGRTLSDFTTTFLVTGKYVERKLMEVWVNLINDESHHSVNYYDDYVADIQVECLNEADEVVYKFGLREAYPASVSALRLDRTAQNQQMVMDVTWAFHKMDTILDNVTTRPTNNTGLSIPVVPGPGAGAGKQRLLPIPGIDQMSAAVQSAAAIGTEFRSQLQGVLNIAKDVREQVRDFKMEAINGVKILNGVVKDVKAIAHIPADVKNEVVAVVTDTKNQLGYMKDDVKNISKYPKR